MASSSVQGRRLSMWWSSDQRKMDFICRTLFLSVSNSVLVTQIKIIRSIERKKYRKAKYNKEGTLKRKIQKDDSSFNVKIRLTDTLENIQTFYGVGKIDATT